MNDNFQAGWDTGMLEAAAIAKECKILSCEGFTPEAAADAMRDIIVGTINGNRQAIGTARIKSQLESKG